MKPEILNALNQHLCGINPHPQFAAPFTIVVGENTDPALLAGEGVTIAASRSAVVFAPAQALQQVEPILLDVGESVQCSGSVGRDGDELVVSGELIVETVALSQLRFSGLIAPTFVSIESNADIQELLSLVDSYENEGSFPDFLASPSLALELGGFLGRCACRTGRPDRLSLLQEGSESGLRTSVNGSFLDASTGVDRHTVSGCEVCKPSILSADRDQRLQDFFAAFLTWRMLRSLGADDISISGGGWWINDAPITRRRCSTRGVVLARSKFGITAYNLETFRSYRLTDDAARILELELWAEPDFAVEFAAKRGLNASELAQAGGTVLGQVGAAREEAA